MQLETTTVRIPNDLPTAPSAPEHARLAHAMREGRAQAIDKFLQSLQTRGVWPATFTGQATTSDAIMGARLEALGIDETAFGIEAEALNAHLKAVHARIHGEQPDAATPFIGDGHKQKEGAE